MITTIDIAQELRRVQDNRSAEAYPILRRILIDSLAPVERRVFDAVVTFNVPVLSSSVAKYEQLSIQHASTILQRLSLYGLLERTEIHDAHGRAWEYRVAE